MVAGVGRGGGVEGESYDWPHNRGRSKYQTTPTNPTWLVSEQSSIQRQWSACSDIRSIHMFIAFET